MKVLPTLSVILGGMAVVAEGKYFSDGWQPGQAATKAVDAAAGRPTAYDPRAPAGAGAAGPVPIDVHAAGRAGGAAAATPVPTYKRPSIGQSIARAFEEPIMRITGGRINTTHVLEAAKQQDMYSRVNDTREGFVRLTDDNWEEEVVYERFAAGLPGQVAERERAWFVFLHGPPRDTTTAIFMEAVTNASLLTQQAGHDLPNVKFARMDFMTETALPTRWLVFRPPQLMIVTNRGQDLRFFGPHHLRPDGEVLRRFLKEEIWKEYPIWKSRWGPGGDRAWLVNAYISVWALWSRLTSRFPTWVLLLGSGLLTQSIMQYLHAKKPEEVARLAALAREKQEQAERALKDGQADSNKASAAVKATATEPKTSATVANKRKGGAKSSDEGDVKVTVKTKKA